MIETFKNNSRNRYTITITCPELTFECPKTGQPDFGKLVIKYVPDSKCIELKSLKLYIWSFRNRGIGYEKLANEIFNTIFEKIYPHKLELTLSFNKRGGIDTEIFISIP